MPNPILVDTLRGEVIENRHRGAIAVCDPRGQLIHAWGDTDALVYPRSAIKLLQALPLLESGAADHFALTPGEIALACSSHNAEAVHVDAVDAWLGRLDLTPDALECGAHPPLDEASAQALLRQGRQPAPIHNNCSGKHTGMLTTACFLGEPTRGYIEPDHPAQQRWFDSLGDMAGVDMRALPQSRDGCGIPVIAMPLGAIATAFARVAAPDDLPASRGDAVARISTAIAANPFMLAGSGRLDTEVLQRLAPGVLIKGGADGVYTAALAKPGLGVAIKIDDGNGDAAGVALLALLRRLGALSADDLDALNERCRIPVYNTRGVLTGHREAAESLL